MSKKLFVGNLPFTTTEDELHSLFTNHGKVASTSLILDKMTGRSRGFGFVEMEDDTAAEAAIAELNNSEMSGRKIVVNEARPMKPKKDFGRNGGGGRNRHGGGGGFHGGW